MSKILLPRCPHGQDEEGRDRIARGGWEEPHAGRFHPVFEEYRPIKAIFWSYKCNKFKFKRNTIRHDCHRRMPWGLICLSRATQQQLLGLFRQQGTPPTHLGAVRSLHKPCAKTAELKPAKQKAHEADWKTTVCKLMSDAYWDRSCIFGRRYSRYPL